MEPSGGKDTSPSKHQPDSGHDADQGSGAIPPAPPSARDSQHSRAGARGRAPAAPYSALSHADAAPAATHGPRTAALPLRGVLAALLHGPAPPQLSHAMTQPAASTFAVSSTMVTSDGSSTGGNSSAMHVATAPAGPCQAPPATAALQAMLMRPLQPGSPALGAASTGMASMGMTTGSMQQAGHTQKQEQEQQLQQHAPDLRAQPTLPHAEQGAQQQQAPNLSSTSNGSGPGGASQHKRSLAEALPDSVCGDGSPPSKRMQSVHNLCDTGGKEGEGQGAMSSSTSGTRGEQCSQVQ